MKNTVLFVLINTFSGIGYSLVSPLFPILGDKEKLNEEILGWIISTYSIAGTILTPFVPKLIKKFSHIKLLCLATFLEAMCTILYGFLIYINSYSFLLVIIFILRTIHGCCSAIIGTLVYSLTISLAYENKVQMSLGHLEIGWSIGTSSGPLFASFCYKFGGYSLPFITLGFLLLFSVYLAKHIDSEKLKNDDEDKNNPPFTSFLVNSKIFIILCGFIVVLIVSSYYFPCLTNHLTDNYNLSISTSSLFFVIPIVSYILILQFLDKISSNFGIYSTFSCGIIVTSISPFFLYPCPPLPKKLIIIIIGFLLIGIGSAPVFIPGLVVLAKIIREIDSNIDPLTANDISSAINNLTIDIGEFIGPIIGGFFTTRYNFKYCCFFVFIIGIFYSGLFILYFFKNIGNDLNLYIANNPPSDQLNIYIIIIKILLLLNFLLILFNLK